MNKCFLLNTEKNLTHIRLVVFEKNAKNAHFNSKIKVHFRKMQKTHTLILTLILQLSVRFLRFSRKRQDGFVPNFFQDLGENTCLLQPALKSNVLGL